MPVVRATFGAKVKEEEAEARGGGLRREQVSGILGLLKRIGLLLFNVIGPHSILC